MTFSGGRSAKLTVLGTLGIIFGGLWALGGLCGLLVGSSPTLSGQFAREMAARTEGGESGQAITLNPAWGVALGANMAIGIMLLVASVGILKLRRWARVLATGVAGLMVLRFVIGSVGLRAARAGSLTFGPVLVAFVTDFAYPLILILILNSASARQEFSDAQDRPFGA